MGGTCWDGIVSVTTSAPRGLEYADRPLTVDCVDDDAIDSETAFRIALEVLTP